MTENENSRTVIIECPVCEEPFEYTEDTDEPHCGRPKCSGKYQDFQDQLAGDLLK